MKYLIYLPPAHCYLAEPIPTETELKFAAQKMAKGTTDPKLAMKYSLEDLDRAMKYGMIGVIIAVEDDKEEPKTLIVPA